MALPLTVLLCAAALIIGGCADELEQQTVNDVPEHLQRGITGEGRLGPRDRSDDPYIKTRNADPEQ